MKYLIIYARVPTGIYTIHNNTTAAGAVNRIVQLIYSVGIAVHVSFSTYARLRMFYCHYFFFNVFRFFFLTRIRVYKLTRTVNVIMH